jgi:hypothetical protein
MNKRIREKKAKRRERAIRELKAFFDRVGIMTIRLDGNGKEEIVF